jgi:uncharacterized protein YcbX
VLRGPPKILHAPGHSFSDVARKVVSIINLDSLAALADVVRAPVDPLRFRANVYVAGWPVWSELDFVGKVLAAGPRAKLKVVKRIVRCAATNVDPQTGIRDLNVPQALLCGAARLQPQADQRLPVWKRADNAGVPQGEANGRSGHMGGSRPATPKSCFVWSSSSEAWRASNTTPSSSCVDPF